MADRITCVLVDDDRDYLELESHYLARARPDVDIVPLSHGEAAVDYVRAHPVNLVITDFRMPGMDGLELIDAIRQFNRQIPILMVSENEIEAEALAAGANVFITKSVFHRNHRALVDDLLQLSLSRPYPRSHDGLTPLNRAATPGKTGSPAAAPARTAAPLRSRAYRPS